MERYPKDLIHLKILTFACSLLALQAGTTTLSAETFYVATDGSDQNPGTSTKPWRSIQKGAGTIGAGDTLLVRAGTYDERVTTFHSGTNESGRIRFIADGQVVMKGWIVNHRFVSVKGFEITGHWGLLNRDAYVWVGNGGDFFELEACRIRDGVGVYRTNMVFLEPRTIMCASGGFKAAGFAEGQKIEVSRATNITVLNASSYVVSSVTDTEMTVIEGSIQSDGPVPAYITGSPNYALFLDSGTEQCCVRSNTFANLSYRYWFVQGQGHEFEGNVVQRNNGWDVMFYMGSDHVFRGNRFFSNGWGTFQPSADVFDNWPVKYERIQFTNNFVLDFAGVINAQKRNNTFSGPLWITRNVFVDVGWLSLRFPNTVFEQNTLLRVARHGTPAVQVERHPVIVNSQDYATNVVIRNNIFIDCGQSTGAISPAEVGWYRFVGPQDSAILQGNFVAGAAPRYAEKTGWQEASPQLNGGDPEFLNVDDPLGPDGVPFTEDDGLRLLSTSKLIGAGASGQTPGAYAEPANFGLSLTVELLGGARLRLRWRAVGEEEWMVEGADSLAGGWSLREVSKETVGDYVEVTLPATNRVEWFRLRR